MTRSVRLAETLRPSVRLIIMDNIVARALHDNPRGVGLVIGRIYPMTFSQARDLLKTDDREHQLHPGTARTARADLQLGVLRAAEERLRGAGYVFPHDRYDELPLDPLVAFTTPTTCSAKSMALALLARALGFATRFRWEYEGERFAHVQPEVLIGGSWVRFEPTLSPAMMPG